MKMLNPDWPIFESNGEDSYDSHVERVIYDVLNIDEVPTDRTGQTYTFVGQFLEDDNFYQGLNKVSVIRRDSDGVLFGYSWWDDISKHGESMVEPNGEQFGLDCDTDADNFDWDNDYVAYFVWEPVEEYTIKAYRKAPQ